MRTRKLVYVLVLAFLVQVAQVVQAVPAKGGLAKVVQPDGSTLVIDRHGDEFFHYTTTSDGYHIVQHRDNFYYYFQDVATRSTASVRASDPAKRAVDERIYLQNRSKGVDPQFKTRARSASSGRMASIRSNTKSMQDLSLNTKVTRAKTFAPRGLVIVVEFSDIKLQSKHTKASFSDLLNQKGYSANNGTGSAKDYFIDNSNGAYSPTFDIGAIVTLSHTMSYYGANDGEGQDGKPKQMIEDACRAADGQVNFSDYDTDGDGKVDNVFVYYAGYNEAENGPENSVWPHRWSLSQPLMLDGVAVSDYACTSELRGNTGTTLAGMGTFTHEFGHVLGLPDLYDTDYEVGGQSPGMYSMSIMAQGSYLNDGCTPPYYNGMERNLLGWGELKELAVGSHTIRPINEENQAWVIRTSSDKEMYIIESRGNQGWDKYLHGYGLMIYHIDQSDNLRGSMSAKNRWKENSINAVLGLECVQMVESTGSTLRDMFDASGLLFPGTSHNTSFLASSYRGVDNSGVPITMEISSISAQATGVSTIQVRQALALVSISGSVQSGGAPVADAVVSLTLRKVLSTPSNSSTLPKSIPYRASNTKKALTATTNANGTFVIDNVTQGDYIIDIEKTGYDVATENITVNEGWSMRDFELKALPDRLCEGVTWMQGAVTYLIQADRSQRLAVLWDAQDLASMVGDTISAIQVFTGRSTSLALTVTSSTGQVLFKRDVAATTPNGTTTIRIKEGALVVPSNGSLRVEMSFGSTDYVIGTDNGPVQDGKGNLVSHDNATTWSSLGRTSNLAVTLEKYKPNGDLSKPQIQVTKTKQRGATLALNSTDSNIKEWILRHKVATDVTWNENIIQASKFASVIRLVELTPNTQYDFELQSVFADKVSATTSATLSTLPLTAPFSAMEDIVSQYKVGDVYMPAVTNLQQEPLSIEWSVDNSPIITTQDITFTAAGKFSIRCAITYKDRPKEVITRVVKVL